MSSISIFKGFKGTIPTHSDTNLHPLMVCQYLTGTLQVCTEKENVIYTTPIVFQHGPYSNATAIWKKRLGQTEGVQRSAAHAINCSARHVVFDFDEIDNDTAEKIRKWAAKSKVQSLAYSSYSHGKPGIFGQSFRLVVWLDSPVVGTPQYTTVWRGINSEHLFDAADPSSSKPYQMQGVWATHPDWKEAAWCTQVITNGTPLNTAKYLDRGEQVMAASPFKKDGIEGEAKLTLMNDEASASIGMMVPLRVTAEQQSIYDALCMLNSASTELLICVYGNLKALGDEYQGHFENWVYSSPEAITKYRSKHPTKYDPRHMWTKNGWSASVSRDAALGKIKQLARSSAFEMLCNSLPDTIEAKVGLTYLRTYHCRWLEKELAAYDSATASTENMQ